MTLTETLDSGLEVHVSAKRVGSGLAVTVWAEPSELTRAYDARFQSDLDKYLAAAERGEHVDMAFPDTGAESMLIGLELRQADGRMAPHSVTRQLGGSEMPWRSVYQSPDWQPTEVLIAGQGIAIRVPVEA